MFLRVLEPSGVSARPVATFPFRIPYFQIFRISIFPYVRWNPGLPQRTREGLGGGGGILYSTQTSASQEILPFAPGIDENLAVPWLWA